MPRGKGADERGARFAIDRLGEVEAGDFGGRVIRRGVMVKDVMDGSPRKPATIPSAAGGTALRCNTRCGDWRLAVAGSQDGARPMRREYGDAVFNRPNPPEATSSAHPLCKRGSRAADGMAACVCVNKSDRRQAGCCARAQAATMPPRRRAA